VLYDLSPTVHANLPVWPGDTPFQVELAWSIAAGAAVNLSAITTTPHLGSHADAPFHTEPRGETAAELSLEPFLGPCRVVEVPGVPLLEPRHLEGVELGNPPRLLLKTGSVSDWRRFPERFSALSPELAALLGERGIVLVGLDTPSVDPFTSKTMDAHHALCRRGVAILEGLLLDGVPPGLYELIALPLKLAGVDASPVRAVLRSLPE
jgi:arylformamidase